MTGQVDLFAALERADQTPALAKLRPGRPRIRINGRRGPRGTGPGGEDAAPAIHASLDGEYVRCESAGFPGDRAVAVLRKIPGREYLPGPPPANLLPISSAREIAAAVEGGVIVASDAVRAALAQEIARQDAAAAQSRAADAAPIEIPGFGAPGLELLPFQRAGLHYILDGEDHRGIRCIVADEMGLGKTVTGCAVIAHVRAHHPGLAVVIAPQATLYGWREHLERWIPGIGRVEVLRTRKPVPIARDVSVVVINPDILTAWRSTIAARDPVAIVIDEAHRFRTGKAARVKSALCRRRSVRCRLLLTGTPIDSGPKEFISLLKLAGRFDELGTWREFEHRYLIPRIVKRRKKDARGVWREVEEQLGHERGGRNLRELNDRLRRRGGYLRREKAVVYPELGKIGHARVALEIGRGAYDREVRAVVADLRRARVEMAKAEREEREPEGWAVAAAAVAGGKLLRAVGRAKTGPAIEWLKGQMETEPLVVFAWHRDVVEALAEGLGVPAIYGGVSAERRAEYVAAFQEGKIPALVLNYRAGGEGLTLTRSSNVVLVEPPATLSPSAVDQAIARLHRHGQERAVTAWRMIAPQTIDDRAYASIERKREARDAATEGEAPSRSRADELRGLEEFLGC